MWGISQDPLRDTEHLQAIVRGEPFVPEAIPQDLHMLAVPERIGQEVLKQHETAAKEKVILRPIINWPTPRTLDAASARSNVQACPDLDIDES